MKQQNRGLKAVIANMKWWQVGLVAIAASVVGSLTGGPLGDEQTKIYTSELKQAPWAPPKWLFGPAWTLNNYFLLMGLQRLIQQSELQERKKLLLYQSAIWFIFFTFNFVYFRKKSTVLAAVWTVTDAVLAICSICAAAKGDKKTAAAYAPLTVWTGFASTLAIYQALKNDDRLLGLKALA